MNDQRGRLGSCKLYSIVWIAVIVPELTAAIAMLDEEHLPPDDFQQNESDENKYIWGSIGAHNILIAFLPAGSTGTTDAATTVARFRSSLPHIKYGVLVGIAGAIPKTTVQANKLCIDKKRDVRLGDVVVGYPCGGYPGVVQYDLGKSKQGEPWERTGSLNKPPDRLLSVVQFLQSKRDRIHLQMQTHVNKMIEKDPSMEDELKHQGAAHDRLFNPSHVHSFNSPDCSNCDPSQEIFRQRRESTYPAVHYGLILSGNNLKTNALERDDIAKRIGKDCICFEMEAAGVVSQLPCLVIRGISSYADSHKSDLWQSYAAATAAAYAKIVICNVGPHVQLEKVSSTEVALLFAPVSESVKKLQAQNERIEQSCGTVASAAELEVLSRLPISDQARYDSLEEGKSPLCLPETREDVLEQLSDWLKKEGSRTLWLNGMAGTGKSTISRSFATDLEERSQLVASFFFKRDDLKRGRVQMFSSSIAADLARRFPTARASIVDTLREYNGVAHIQAQKQFQLLVLDPLSRVQLDKNVAIVIDAVDECNESDLECFFALVSTFQRAELPRVKLFFTSRPDLVVLREFDTRTDECATIALQKVPDFIIENDIRIFLEHGLRKVRNKYNRMVDECEQLGPDWPSLEDRQKLLRISNHLFIFAATICRLLEKCSKTSPDLHLKDVLELKTTTGHAFKSIYRPVLDRQIPDDTDISEEEKEGLICEYKQVLGAICVLRSPISVPALARLLGLDVKTVECRLRSLQSVIEVIKPEGSKSKEDTRIRLLHSSFREFLLSKEVQRISQIWVDEQNAHHFMMERCLATLSRPKTGLRFNICGLASPGTSRQSVSQEDLESCLTQDLAYACRHLTGHAVSANFKITDGDEIHQFLLSHLLHWLEASTYLENFANPAREFLRLQSLASPNGESKKVLSFLEDAYRFAALRWNSLDQAPLQIYTALLFAPWNSIVRKTFENRYNAWVLEKPEVGADWGIDFMDIAVEPLPHRGILKLLFSPSKEIVAAMSWNTIWLMTLLGEQLLRIQIDNPIGDHESPLAVVFSSNSKLIALRNGIDEIQIWNIEDEIRALVKKIGLSEVGYDADYFHRPRSFTHNDSHVLIASHHFADIWSIENGRHGGRYYFPSAAHQVAVSPDCSTLVGHFGDALIFWNLYSGQQMRETSLSTEAKDPCYDLILSSNEIAWIITVNSVGGQQVYAAGFVDPLAYLRDDDNAYTIFEDYLAIEYDDQIRIWKYGNMRPQVIKKPRPGPVSTIAYISKPNESLLVSSTTDEIEPGVIFFYKLPEYQPRNTDCSPYLEQSGYPDGFSDIFLSSSNGTMLASIGSQGAHILSTKRYDNEFIYQEGLIRNIAFSSTGDRIAASDGRKLWVWDRSPKPWVWDRSPKPWVWDRSPKPWVWDRSPKLKFERKCCDDVNGEDIFIKHAMFSSEERFLSIVYCCKNGTEVACLAVPDYDLIACASVSHSDVEKAVLSPDGRLLAMVRKEEVDIWEVTAENVDVNGQPILTVPGYYHAVELSPTLALLTGETSLEIWDIRQGRILQSRPRPSEFDATFDPVQDIFLTNYGKMAFRIASGTGQDLLPESRTDKALVSGHSVATTPQEPQYMTLRIGWGIARNGFWITWNDQNWIRLPTDYSAHTSAVDENRVLIVSEARKPAWYKFDEAPVFEERLDDVDVEMTDYNQDVPIGLGLTQCGESAHDIWSIYN